MRTPFIGLLIFGFVVVLITGNWDWVVAHTLSEKTWGLYTRDFFENVLVEAHGAVIDLFVVGVVLFWFEQRRARNDTIKTLRNTLADLKLYRGDDASYRILGQVKRLLELGVNSFELPEAMLSDIDLADVSLQSSNLRAANFTNSKLRKVNLENCECDAAIFVGAQFQHVSLLSVRLRRAKFRGAKLNGCDFSQCEIQMADFTDADLRSANFAGVDCSGVKFKNADLRSANFIGAKNLHPDALKDARDVKHVKFVSHSSDGS